MESVRSLVTENHKYMVLTTELFTMVCIVEGVGMFFLEGGKDFKGLLHKLLTKLYNISSKRKVG